MRGMKKIIITTCVAIWSVAAAAGAWANDWYQEGERVAYDIRWLALKAGEAELMFAPDHDNNTYTVVGRAWTSGTLNSFVRIYDRLRVEGTLPDFLPKNYHLQLNENDYKANKRVAYNHVSQTAVYENIQGKEKPRTYDIDEQARDMLSSLLYLRKTVDEVDIGKTYTLPVFELDKGATMELEVQTVDTIKIPLGKMKALRIHPVLKQEVQKPKGKWHIWVTNDERFIPVQI